MIISLLNNYNNFCLINILKQINGHYSFKGKDNKIWSFLVPFENVNMFNNNYINWGG